MDYINAIYIPFSNLNVYDLIIDVAYLGCYNLIPRDKYDVLLTRIGLTLSDFQKRCPEKVQNNEYSHFGFFSAMYCLSGPLFHGVYMENGRNPCPYNYMKLGDTTYMDVYAFKSKLKFKCETLAKYWVSWSAKVKILFEKACHSKDCFFLIEGCLKVFKIIIRFNSLAQFKSYTNCC